MTDPAGYGTPTEGELDIERVIRRWDEIEAQGAIPDDPTTWECPDCGEQLATDAEQGLRCLACGTGFGDDADPSMEGDR